MTEEERVGILMLTHNAPRYVWKSLKTIKKRTRYSNYELVVVDNKSKFPTRILLRLARKLAYLDTCYFNPENSLFAKGNNIAFSKMSSNCSLVLLLNSDVEIIDGNWLTKLTNLHLLHGGGGTSFGAVREDPQRADGYCLLLDRSIYDRYKLDEAFEWFWSVTKLQCQIAEMGKTVWAIEEHEEYLHHFGGKSGKGFKDAAGMDVRLSEIKSWFTDKANANIVLFKTAHDALKSVNADGGV